MENKIVVGKSSSNEEAIFLTKMANRHGFIGGATGTGKTVTLKHLCESFSDLGVPCFLSDIKGDLSGFVLKGYPVNFYDIYKERGIPLRCSITEMGPELLSRIMNLSKVGTEVLKVAFKIADDNELLLLDTKDLKKMLSWIAENKKELSKEYGSLDEKSINTIIRNIITLETEGADEFFGEPSIDINDFILHDANNKGMINILNAKSLINRPRLYSAFMLYLLSALFEMLPEVGDLEKPKLVFFFDEAHLLFSNADKELIELIQQTVKLIRSKGVSIFFITQNPNDIDNAVLSQLSNKIEHGLRAYTPAEKKKIKAIADSFRENKGFDVESEIENLGTGEAVVSFLDEKGIPTPAMKIKVCAAKSMDANVKDEDLKSLIETSVLYAKYKTVLDKESAYEKLSSIVTANASNNSDVNVSQNKNDEIQTSKSVSEKKKSNSKSKVSKDDMGSTISGIKIPKELKKIINSAIQTTGTTVGRSLGSSLTKGSSNTLYKRTVTNVSSSLARNLLGTLSKQLFK